MSKTELDFHVADLDAVVESLRTHHDRFADGAQAFCVDSSFAEAFRTLGRSERRTLERRTI